ncbi:MAG: SDR family oxidoreductase [Alphaproteobacteria bacterium]|nr:SDR family oxidoreductase [Alphaproteobacteria bacterium]
MSVALVTGSARRLGRAIALELASAGFDVAVHFNSSRADAEQTAAEIQKRGRKAALVEGDLSRESDVVKIVPSAAKALGPLTALVNNASVFKDDRIDTMTRATWDLHIETNLRAPLVLAQAFARQLPAGTDGAIVNMLDQAVWKLTPQFLSYTVSKTGLWTLTRTLAQALAPRIRVNGIGPGPTLKATQQSAENFARQVDATLLKRAPTPEDIAQAVRYLMSAKAVTGQMIAVDSGQHLAWQTDDLFD